MGRDGNVPHVSSRAGLCRRSVASNFLPTWDARGSAWVHRVQLVPSGVIVPSPHARAYILHAWNV